MWYTVGVSDIKGVVYMKKSSLSITAQRLRLCREQREETLEQVARVLGVNKTTVMRWESGSTPNVSRATLNLLAQHYGVTVEWLRGDETVRHQSEWLSPSGVATKAAVSLPILGTVRAGFGGGVFEEVIGHETTSADRVQTGEEYCWFRVSGDSMTPLINEGDLVLIRRQEQVDSGDYAVAVIDNEEGTVKRILLTPDGLELHSVNPYYPPRRFVGEDAARVRILGRVMESKRKF